MHDALRLAWDITQVLLPPLFLVLAGWALARKGGADLSTLTRLNFWITIPALTFVSIVEARAGTGHLAILFTAGLTGAMMLAGLALAKSMRLPPEDRTAAVLCAGFANYGNIGVPVQAIAFRPLGLSNEAVAMETMVLITISVITFTLGLVLAPPSGSGAERLSGRIWTLFKQPTVWALLAGGVVRGLAAILPEQVNDAVAVAARPGWDALVYGRDAFVAVALTAFGAQLAHVGARAKVESVAGQGSQSARVHRRAAKAIVPLRALGAPVLMTLALWASGARGIEAQVLLIASAMPCGVNALLLCQQAGRGAGTAARTVLWSTLLSPIPIAACIAAVRLGAFA